MIKLIAALTMLTDHIGLVLFPDVLMLRLVGRLSMPLFAYVLARGYEHCRMKRGYLRYILRLVLFAAVSQFPFRFMVGDARTLNVGFTWLFALSVLALYDRERHREPDFVSPAAAMGAVFLAFVAAGVVWTDYGVYGILLPVAFHYGLVRHKDYYRTLALFAALWGVYTVIFGGSVLNIAGASALPLIALMERRGADNRVRLPKYFYYAFYPAHISILLVIQYFMKGA